jgi:hypothetical protein
LIATVAASGDDRPHHNEEGPAGESDPARTEAIRSHDQCPVVSVLLISGDGESLAAQSVPVALSLAV